MPGFYPEGEYDLAGFAVGAVKKEAVINGTRIAAGDVVLGIASSGVHSNGFSLVRKVLEVSGNSLHDKAPWTDESFGIALLTPTVIYVRDCLKLIEAVDVKGFVHITGGGFPENIPRVVPKGFATKIFCGSWNVPPLFRWVQQAGGISDSEMFRTFNMGVGMVVVVPKSDVDKALAADVGAFVMGEIVERDGEGVIMV